MAMTPRILIGRYNGSVGVKTALPGFDVTDTADDDNGDRRSFNSQWPNLLRVAVNGIATIPAPLGAAAVVTITHGLGFVPFYELRKYAANTFYDDRWGLWSAGAYYGAFLSYVNTTQLVVQNLTTSSSSAMYALWQANP